MNGDILVRLAMLERTISTAETMFSKPGRYEENQIVRHIRRRCDLLRKAVEQDSDDGQMKLDVVEEAARTVNPFSHHDYSSDFSLGKISYTSMLERILVEAAQRLKEKNLEIVSVDLARDLSHLEEAHQDQLEDLEAGR